MKRFLVTVTAYLDVLVEADDQDHALDLVSGEAVSPFDWEIDEYNVEREITSDKDWEEAKGSGAVPFDEL